MYFGHDSHINALPNVVQDHLVAHYEFGTYGSSINFVPDLSGWGRHLDVRNANLPAAGTIGLAGNGSSIYALSEAMSHSTAYGTYLNSRQASDATYGQYTRPWTIQLCFNWAVGTQATGRQCLFFLSQDNSLPGQSGHYDVIALYSGRAAAGKLTALCRSYYGALDGTEGPGDIAVHGLYGPVYGVSSNSFITTTGSGPTATYYVAITYDGTNLVMQIGDGPTTFPSIRYTGGLFVLNYAQFLRGWNFEATEFPVGNIYPASGSFDDYSKATIRTFTMYDKVLSASELAANRNHFKRRLGVSTFPNGGA